MTDTPTVVLDVNGHPPMVGSSATPMPNDHPGEGMKMLGIVLAIGGLIILSLSFFYPTTVSVDVPLSVDYPSLTTSREVANLAKQQLQMLLAMSGALVTIIGISLYGFGAVVLEIARRPK